MEEVPARCQHQVKNSDGRMTPTNKTARLTTSCTCLSLGFKFIATMAVILMSALVITTIKTTRSLHKPHIIFIANVMVADIVFTIEVFLSSAVMMIGYASGQGDLISYNLHLFLHYQWLLFISHS